MTPADWLSWARDLVRDPSGFELFLIMVVVWQAVQILTMYRGQREFITSQGRMIETLAAILGVASNGSTNDR
jgi:hypothetical protein